MTDLWGPESKYNTKCLVGNWSEERLGRFVKGTSFGSSTTRTDFQPYSGTDLIPDQKVRREGVARSEGLGREYLVNHHGNAHDGNIISWYDVEYNGRVNRDLPTTRHWDTHNLAWVPEKNDFPVKGEGTRFGLHEKLIEKWTAENQLQKPEGSIAKSSYLPHENDAFSKHRYATPRHFSSHFVSQNINKDLKFRGGPFLPGRPDSLINLPLPDNYLLPQLSKAQLDHIRARNTAGKATELPQVE